MTKTICDIFGKEMSNLMLKNSTISDLKFCISSYGKMWDICPECREDFNRCMVI